MQPTGEKPDATTLAFVGFNVSLACSLERRSSPARNRQLRSGASLLAHSPARGAARGAMPNDSFAISGRPAPPGPRGSWRTWTGASNSVGPRPCRVELDCLEEPTSITNSAVPCCQANAQR